MVSCLWLICQFFWWYFTYLWDTHGKIAQVKHFVKGDPFETTARALCQSVRETLAKQLVKYTKALSAVPCLNEKTAIPSTSTCSEAIAVPKPTIYDNQTPTCCFSLFPRQETLTGPNTFGWAETQPAERLSWWSCDIRFEISSNCLLFHVGKIRSPWHYFIQFKIFFST